MSDNEIINRIRQENSRLWDRLTTEQKREFISQIEGDAWRLNEPLKDFVEART